MDSNNLVKLISTLAEIRAIKNFKRLELSNLDISKKNYQKNKNKIKKEISKLEIISFNLEKGINNLFCKFSKSEIDWKKDGF